MASRINILIIENEDFTLSKIEGVFERNDIIFYTASNYQLGLEHINKTEFDLVICKVKFPNGFGRNKAVFNIQEKFKGIIIFLLELSEKDDLNKLHEFNNHRFILYSLDYNQLKLTVNLALNRISKEKQKIKSLNLNRLTKAEYKILNLISKGLTTKEISEKLFVAQKTIENHRANIVVKLELPPTNNTLLKWSLKNSYLIENRGFPL